LNTQEPKLIVLNWPGYHSSDPLTNKESDIQGEIPLITTG